jgi:hypothetical protein
MATTPTPPDAAAAPEAAPDAPTPPTSTAGVYEYVDLTPRTYFFPGAPQTAEFGDVCPLPHDPGDGRWQPSKKKVSRLPDNDPRQAEVTSARQAIARAEAHGNSEARDAAAKRLADAQALIVKGA